MSETNRPKVGMTRRVLSYTLLMAVVLCCRSRSATARGHFICRRTARSGNRRCAPGSNSIRPGRRFRQNGNLAMYPAWPWMRRTAFGFCIAPDVTPGRCRDGRPARAGVRCRRQFHKIVWGPGNGYEWPEREHGIHIDYKGFVWIGGNNCPARNLPGLKAVGDDQYLKFTQDGKFVMQIGHSNKSTGNSDTKNLQQPADAFVYRKTNEIFIADGYGNHRVIVFDADTGAFKRMWGAFGNPPADLYNCPPPSLNSVPSGEGPPQFSIAHAIRVSDDGLVYLADRENRRVQVFTIEGKFVKQLVKGDIPFARDLTLSPDPEQQFLYVGGGTEIVVVDRKTLEIVESIKGGGVLGGGHLMTTDSKGNIYTAQTIHGLQKLAFKGMSPPSK